MFIGKIFSREKLFHRQKIHFTLLPDNHCNSKNEKLVQLPCYCIINFFSFYFVVIATLNCNFFFCSFYPHNSILTHYFCVSFYEESLFTADFPAINRWFEEADVETDDEFSIIYIFITLFVNNVYFRVQLCFQFRFSL